MTSKTVYFTTPGTLDLRAITIMGLHAKKNESPIGYFGTGLKYAIATLLRNGQDVTIHTNGKTYRIEKREESFREEPFTSLILTDGEESNTLPFTISLGKNWQVWQAYRELHSNTLDEGGSITDSPTEINPEETTIVVEGDACHAAYLNRDEIFHPKVDSPVFEGNRTDILSYSPSHNVYYRGVRVLESKIPFRYTYNIKTECPLTEDRTLPEWHGRFEIANSIMREMNKPSLMQGVLTVHADQYFEGNLRDSCISSVSNTFCEACEEIVSEGLFDLNPYFLSRFEQERQANHEPKAVESLSPLESLDLADAKEIVESLVGKQALAKYPIIITESLGTGGFGLARDGTIYIDRKAFPRGRDFLALVIYEEFTHINTGYGDFTRELQTFLIEQIISLARERMATRLEGCQ